MIGYIQPRAGNFQIASPRTGERASKELGASTGIASAPAGPNLSGRLIDPKRLGPAYCVTGGIPISET